ncbi:GMC oxidoreductase family protein [Sphingomonas sp. S17]|uniref:GMC family oxidoreductase n=1 Tax=Sphingomonas paucimobilis TaxID=13689 RepID=A0A7T3E4C1_SPHPI|nr:MULTISPECIES: GMC family oxidoreductase [Sphingomonas]EGI55359.1 GMC oxidoreductase family protein [Sphingomonas sp. S17]MCM3680941.1 GMC family oxidoreductase [Sphingomonas paucimobilis]MDG5971347.1 GMC family oxidoreductase [Sphingomonas paucimobilis]QPT07375.1 GMC family oxidoreductase [Sphingomonas paucimobilis]
MAQHPVFDAIVVGSGITGGLAAKELTEAGLKVLMIERGPMIEHGSGYTRETLAPWDLEFRGVGDAELYDKDYAVQRKNRHFTEFTQDHFVNDRENPYTTEGETAFNWWRSYQLGGRSLTWGRQCYRWSDYDFDANRRDGHGTDWPIRYADLAPWYDKVEEFIGVAGMAEGLPQLPDGRFQPPMALNAVEQHTREVIGRQWPGRRLTIGRNANLTEAKPDQGRAACQYRSICARGCSYGAYFSTQSSTLPAAQKTGNLTLVTDAVVEAVEQDPATGRATGVRFINTKDGTRQRAYARIVFLNAGSFNSVGVLLRSANEANPHGLANSSGVLGTHIMDHAQSVAGIAIMPGFESHTYFGNRPTGVVIPRFRNLDTIDGKGHTRGFSYQGGAFRAAWTGGKRAAGVGKDYKDSLRDPGMWRMVLVAFADSMPRASNRITLDPAVKDATGLAALRINFAHGAQEHAALADAKTEAAAMLTAAGGHVIMGMDTPNPGGSAIHEMGGARMGHDPRTSVLNKWSQAHDVPNLFVTDGAQMSSSACQNPSLTYMALTARACANAVSMLKEGAI